MSKKAVDVPLVRLFWCNDGHSEPTFGLGLRVCLHQATLYFLFWHVTLDWDA